jgi:putative ABC transport system permease protein
VRALLQDLRYGIRMLWKTPGFTLVAVLTLALGIGANTAVFSVVNAVLFNPFPYREPERLLVIERKNQPSTSAEFHSYPVFNELRGEGRAFDDVAALRSRVLPVEGADGPERVWGEKVSSNFFSVLGVAPILGRAFLPGEDQPNQPNVVVLSYGLWQRRFGGDPSVVGKTLNADKDSFQIVGVMPRDFGFDPSPLTKAEYWTPLSPDPRLLTAWNVNEIRLIARLRPGATAEQARAELNADAERINGDAGEGFKKLNKDYGLSAVTLREYFVGDTQKPLLILLGAVGFVLLIACVNAANLLLAQGVGRQREIAIRTVLGANRRRLLSQMLTESLLLSLASGLVGLLLVMWSLEGIAWLMPKGMVRVEGLSVDRQVLLFTLAASLLTGVLFGLLPSLYGSKPDLQTTLKLGTSASDETRGGFRSLLVVSEVALALVLLVGAGLMVNSFLRLTAVNTGLDTDNVLSMELQMLSRKTGPEQTALAQELVSHIQGLPGVKGAAVVSSLPISESGNSRSGKRSILLQQPFAANPDEEITLEPREATPGYFQTMGIRLLRGRLLADSDTAGSQPVVVVSERLAREAWPGEDPLGKRLRLGGSEKQWPTVVGVVSDIRHHSLEREPTPLLYAPFAQNPDAFASLVVRTANNPAGMFPAVRSEILSTDRRVVVSDVMTMEQRLSDLVAAPRFYTLLLVWFAGMGMLLALVGLYGVVSYTVSQRTREWGIRLALGAQPRDVVGLVVGRGLVLTLVGIALGLGGAFVLSRLLTSLLFGVTASDPATYAAVSILVLAAALLACYVPARRATKVDPMVALRYE